MAGWKNARRCGIRQSTSQTKWINFAKNAQVLSRNTTLKKRWQDRLPPGLGAIVTVATLRALVCIRDGVPETAADHGYDSEQRKTLIGRMSRFDLILDVRPNGHVVRVNYCPPRGTTFCHLRRSTLTRRVLSISIAKLQCANSHFPSSQYERCDH